jgi:GTPase SAR1 family protein
MTINVLIVGDACVGKSTYVRRLIGGEFTPHYIQDGTMTFHTMRIGTTPVEITVSPGAQKYPRLLPEETPDFVIIMFPLNSHLSFKECDLWYNIVQDRYGIVPGMLVGTKSDIRRKVSFGKIMDWTTRRNYQFKTVSSKTKDNVHELMTDIVGEDVALDVDMPERVSIM